jgi:hypothetical protein
MNTEEMEAFSIEEGEQIVIDGFLYRVTKSDYSEDSPDMWLFQAVDEEGIARNILVSIRQCVDVLVE